MNKFTKLLLAIVGGIERTFYLITPILIVGLWVEIMPSSLDWLFWLVGYSSSIFRGIEVGGWLK